MNTINNISSNSSKAQNTSAQFSGADEQFHPISWLQSVGQFLGDEQYNDYLVSSEGAQSVKEAVV